MIVGFSRENSAIRESMANRRSAAAATKTSVLATGLTGLKARSDAVIAQNAVKDQRALYMQD